MQLRRVVWAERDRGEITLIGSIIAVLVGAALAGGTIYVATREDKSPQAYVEVTAASASRDADDVPLITITYKSAFADVASLRNKQLSIEVHCFADQSSPRRSFNGDTLFTVLSGTSHDGALTISPGPQNKDIKGAYRVKCELWRDDKRVATSRAVDLNVPEAGSTQPPTGGIDVSEFVGVYRGTFKLVTGSTADCDAESANREVTISDRGKGKIGVELDAPGNEVGISSFEATVSPALQFSGELLFSPLDDTSIGPFAGRFEREAGNPVLKATFTRDGPRCAYEYKGTMGSSGASVVVMTLEEIPGVDGCRAVLDKTRVKAGTITFKATNNTFGFAQTYVYDAGGNYVASNDKDIPRRGGGVIEFTAELSPGNYMVTCDGPGGDDEQTRLVAE